MNAVGEVSNAALHFLQVVLKLKRITLVIWVNINPQKAKPEQKLYYVRDLILWQARSYQ